MMIEDSPSNAALYSTFLKNAGHETVVAETGKSAISQFGAVEPDLVLLDLQLPDMDGLDVIEEISKNHRLPPIVVLTGNGSVRAAASAMRIGAVDFLMKPCSPDKLTEAVTLGLERFQAKPDKPIESEVAGARTVAPPAPGKTRKPATPGPSGFFGQSQPMENVFALIEAAARSSASVFITGESGTGKELCAQAIHKASPRHNGPFVPLNCAAIPKELIESEIFGHRKGSFTVAVQDREGAAGLADGGTLFLDEICEMNLDLQAKLLRFIQTGTYRRVGDEVDRQADIRFVCATNRDPFEEVQAGRFREDLYFRLHVIPITMPPLRDRGKDVLRLAERFLRDFSTIEGKVFEGFDDAAAEIIETYSWPGNVRQLENTIRNIVVLNTGALVSPHMMPALPGRFVKPAAETSTSPGGEPVEAPMTSVMPSDRWFVRPIEELEMMAIDAAIRYYDGNITQASRALNISTSSIYRKKKAWEEREKAG